MEICTEYFRSIACKEKGIKPIIGTEAYMAYESRFERPRRGRGKASEFPDSGGNTDEGRKLYYHLTLLAENNTGYKNLIQIASRLHGGFLLQAKG